MENKYFHPSIEEIHVGYEFQRFIPRSNATEEECWETIKLPVNYLSLDEIDNEIIEKEIRVPYLTKEQIEAEGWENIAVYRDGGTTIFLIKNSKYSYELTFRGRAHLTPSDKITITEIRETPDRPVRVNIFTGECKDINTFRKIIKLLGI